MQATRSVICFVLSLFLIAAAPADDGLDAVRQQTIRQAVQRVAPCVVQIETAGGAERVGRVLKATGPTTGLVVGADGWIISSSFNLAHRPAGVLVHLPDGRRLAARIVGTDHSRMLTLLKIEATGLPVPDACSPGEMHTGQTVLALGRTYDLERPNVSVGIISALGRIWGRAIQTDAKISPVNYGGPLIDLQGRVLGVLAPLSPMASDVAAGVEWYDSGIGFAIPLDSVVGSLDRLRKGDMYPGLMGVMFSSGDLYSDPPTVAKLAWRSPAEAAGLKAGDRILSADGKPVERQAQFRHVIGTKYAGESITVAVKRGNDTITHKIDLIDKLPIYTRPIVGFLPRRDRPAAGVIVQTVLPGLPAEKAGLKAGDKLVAVDGQAIKARVDVEQACDRHQVGETVALKVVRAGQTVDLTMTAAAIPADTPNSIVEHPAPAGAKSPHPTGLIERTLPAGGGKFQAYVPDDYSPAIAHGLVIWFSTKGSPARNLVVDAWKETCKRRDLFLLVAESAKPDQWQPADFNKVDAAIKDLKTTYMVDDARIIVHGQGPSAPLAENFLQPRRKTIRGAILASGGNLQAPPSDPEQKVAYFVVWSKQDPQNRALAGGVDRLRKQRHPTAARVLAQPAKVYLAAENLEEIGRWTELLAAL